MRTTLFGPLLLGLWILIASSSSFAQCRTAPALDSCQASPAPVNNEIMTAGIKKYYSGAATTFSQLTLRGATLVVCSQLTITNLVLDSGTIVIRPGAKLTAGGGGSGMIWRGGCYLYNYGTFEITTNLSLEGPNTSATRPNVLMNVTTSAVISDDFNYFVINDPYSWFVNKGKASFGGIITDNNASPGSVCLQSTSETKERILINKVKNAYAIPNNYACLNVTTLSQFTDTLTANTALLVCLASGHSSSTGGANKPNAWGAAQVSQNCSACAGLALLPMEDTDSRKPSARPESTFVVLYPNPFSQAFRIKWSRGEAPRAIRLFDHHGRLVHQQAIPPGIIVNQLITLPATLPAGCYTAQLTFRYGVTSYKMVKIEL